MTTTRIDQSKSPLFKRIDNAFLARGIAEMDATLDAVHKLCLDAFSMTPFGENTSWWENFRRPTHASSIYQQAYNRLWERLSDFKNLKVREPAAFEELFNQRNDITPALIEKEDKTHSTDILQHPSSIAPLKLLYYIIDFLAILFIYNFIK